MTPNYALELRTRGKQVLYVTLLALTAAGRASCPDRATYDADTDEFQIRWRTNGEDRRFRLPWTTKRPTGRD